MTSEGEVEERYEVLEGIVNLKAFGISCLVRSISTG